MTVDGMYVKNACAGNTMTPDMSSTSDGVGSVIKVKGIGMLILRIKHRRGGVRNYLPRKVGILIPGCMVKVNV